MQGSVEFVFSFRSPYAWLVRPSVDEPDRARPHAALLHADRAARGAA